MTSTVLAYALPALLITMLPGPDTVVVITTAATAGRRAAVHAALGVGTGLLMWGLMTALGLAVVLRSSATAYEVFRLGCAAYLIVIGIRALRSRASGCGEDTVQKTGRWSLGWGYRRALVTCALNPKLAVFFVVVLPEFIPDGASLATTTFALAALQAVEAVAWYVLLGWFVSSAARSFSSGSLRRWLDKVTGVLFVGLGARLMLEAGRP